MKSRLGWLALVLLSLTVALQSAVVRAEAKTGEEKPAEGKKKGGGYIGMLLTIEKLEEKLGEKFTDEQKTKITAKRDEVKKVLEEKKEDKDASKAAIEDYKKFLTELLGEEKVAKAFARPEKKTGEAKTGEAHKTGDAPKEAPKTGEAPGGEMK